MDWLRLRVGLVREIIWRIDTLNFVLFSPYNMMKYEEFSDYGGSSYKICVKALRDFDLI